MKNDILRLVLASLITLSAGLLASSSPRFPYPTPDQFLVPGDARLACPAWGRRVSANLNATRLIVGISARLRFNSAAPRAQSELESTSW